MITEEEWQVIYSALGCVSSESTCTLTETLVDCAKQIVSLHMNNDIEVDVDYNDGLLQISVPKKKYGELSLFLSKISFLKEIKLNLAIEHNYKSFFKLIVKVKNKIVADGIKTQDFKPHHSGKHVNAKQFNELLSCSNTICIDVRNHYESEIGHFIGALTPDVDTFSDSLPIIENQLSKFNKDKNILMYCTGGIRCEKASAYIKHKGYKNVYQLSGGIIQYAREVKEMKIKNFFKGKNFVFDDRRSEKVTDEVISKCHQCGEKSDRHVNCFNNACNLLFIQCKSCQKKMKNCCLNRHHPRK